MDASASESAGGAGSAVKVAVRVRPLITRELLQGSRPCISADGPCITVGRDRRFTFDHAFGPNTKQEQLYSEMVGPLVESCFDGFNVTVLAYGQTGSGKTFTMGTGEMAPGGEEGAMGIAPRVIRHIFQGIEARRSAVAFYVRAQFLEIYNEDVKDLLAPPAEQVIKWISRDVGSSQSAGGCGLGGTQAAQGGISLRDAGDGTIIVIGAREEPAECVEDLRELLERGMAARATSSTLANEQSSRSHAILTIIIEQHSLATASLDSSSSGGAGGAVDGGAAGRGSGGGLMAAGEVRTAKLHLVDLAGSERTKQLRSSMQGQQGARFRETVNINQGLLALGNVISALGDERRRGSHVPYRESKLTRLLQDSLGGNSRTAMIACVSPADEVLEETLNTLKYANRAKNIRNKPVVNRALPASAMSPLRGAVQEVQLQVLQQLVAQLVAHSTGGGAGSSAHNRGLAAALPLAELMALDIGDPAGCLQVLTKTKEVLTRAAAAAAGDAIASGAGAEVSVDECGGGGVAGEEESALLAGCSRAIAGILQSLAEMEAQGHVNPEAREHILKSLDASTLGLLPVVRSLAPISATAGVSATTSAAATPRAASLSALATPLHRLHLAFDQAADTSSGAGVAAAAGIAAQPTPRSVPPASPLAAGTPAQGLTADATVSGSDGSGGPGASALEERVRQLEAELAGVRAELREAKEDLERDEIIFADKMKELQDARTGCAEAQQRLREVEAQHGREAEELRGQVASLKQQLQHQARLLSAAAAARGSSAAGSRNSSRPSSGCGVRRPAQGAADGGESVDGGLSDEVLYDEELLSYISDTEYGEQHMISGGGPSQREVLESDAALREELAAVLRDKAAAEAERAALERAAVAQRTSFDAARAALEQQLSSLSSDILRQQQQLEAAQAAEREAKELAARWQERAEELEAAIDSREAALERLRSELAAVEGGAARSSEERAALRQQYEQRIAAVTAQVAALQRQLQQHAAAAGSSERRDRTSAAERAAALEAELGKLRTHQSDLKKQLSERISKYERDAAGRLKELAALRKAAATARGRIEALEQENRAQRVLLREKQAEVAAANQRLRDSQRSLGSSGGLGGAGSRATSPGRPGYNRPGGMDARGSREGFTSPPPAYSVLRASLQGEAGAAARHRSPGRGGPPAHLAGRSSSGGGSHGGGSGAAPAQALALAASQEVQTQTCDSALSAQEQQEVKGWATQLLLVVTELGAVQARAEVLSARQAELRQRREALEHEAAQLDLRTQRRAEQLTAAVAACDAELADLLGRVPSPRYDTPPASAPGTPRMVAAAMAAASAAPAGTAAGDAKLLKDGAGFGGNRALMSDDWVALQQRIADVSHAKAKLEERLSSGRLLEEREQQAVDSLDDARDDLETQLSYVAGELADRRGAAERLRRLRDQVLGLGGEVGAEGLRLALEAAAEAVGHRSYRVRQLEAALAASEEGAARREAQLQERLRESLVSLSAHLATLEANSPNSSATLNSVELRNLLDVYLEGGSGGGGSGTGGTGGGPLGSDAGRAAPGGSGGGSRDAAELPADAAAAHQTEATQQLSAAAWSDGSGGGMGGDVDPFGSVQVLTEDGGHSAPVSVSGSHSQAISSLSSWVASGSGGSGSQQQQQQHLGTPQRGPASAMGGSGAGTPVAAQGSGGGGILRRNGSMDSARSSASGAGYGPSSSGKRVTWGSVAAVEVQPSQAPAGRPQPQPSILDRGNTWGNGQAGPAARPPSAPSRAPPHLGMVPQLGTGGPGLGSGRSSADGGDDTAAAVDRRSGGNSHPHSAGAGAGAGEKLQDGTGAGPGGKVAPQSQAPQAGLRSYNPWQQQRQPGAGAGENDLMPQDSGFSLLSAECSTLSVQDATNRNRSAVASGTACGPGSGYNGCAQEATGRGPQLHGAVDLVRGPVQEAHGHERAGGVAAPALTAPSRQLAPPRQAGSDRRAVADFAEEGDEEEEEDGLGYADEEELEQQVRLLAQAVAASSGHGHGHGSQSAPSVGSGGAGAAGSEVAADTVPVSRTGTGSWASQTDLEYDLVLPPEAVAAAGAVLPQASRSAGVAVSHGLASHADGHGYGAPSNGTRDLQLGQEPEHQAEQQQPRPLPAPVRSSSPVHNHYGRPQRLADAPGAFTAPAPSPAVAALSEALLPYKSHLRRAGSGSGSGAGSGAAVAVPAGPGGAGATAGRSGTPDGRRPASGAPHMKVGFASPQHVPLPAPVPSAGLKPRGAVQALWSADESALGSGARAQQLQQRGPAVAPGSAAQAQALPWRPAPAQRDAAGPSHALTAAALAGGAGSAAGAGSGGNSAALMRASIGSVGSVGGGSSNRMDMDERQAAMIRAARARGFLP